MDKLKYRTKRVVWYKDHDGIWNGLFLKGRANEVRKSVEVEIARCKAEGYDGHVTDGFNKIHEWTCQPVQA